MVAGKRLQEHTVRQQVLDGLYSTNLPDAFRRFGTDFVEVYPIPLSCCISNLQGKHTIYVLDPNA